MKTNTNTTGTQDNDFNLFPPQVLTNTNTELYDVFAGNGHRLIARGVAYEKAEQMARDFELRCARDGVEVPKSNIVKQQASLNTERGIDE